MRDCFCSSQPPGQEGGEGGWHIVQRVEGQQKNRVPGIDDVGE